MRVRNLEGGGMVGGPQLSLPLLMPQKGVLLWLAPRPIPHVQLLWRRWAGDVGRGRSVSGPQRGGRWGGSAPVSHALTTLISQGEVEEVGQARSPSPLDYRRKGLVLGAGGPGGIMGGRPGPPPRGEM